MYELYGQRAFPDGGSDPLDGPMSRVADDEDPWLTGLQGKWLSFEWPPMARAPIRQEIAAGQVEPVFVEPQPICHSLRSWFASDENEEGVRRHLCIDLGCVVVDHQLLQPTLPDGACDSRSRSDADAGMLFAALDEILRHFFAQVASPNDERDGPRILGEV